MTMEMRNLVVTRPPDLGGGSNSLVLVPSSYRRGPTRTQLTNLMTKISNGTRTTLSAPMVSTSISSVGLQQSHLPLPTSLPVATVPPTTNPHPSSTAAQPTQPQPQCPLNGTNRPIVQGQPQILSAITVATVRPTTNALVGRRAPPQQQAAIPAAVVSLGAETTSIIPTSSHISSPTTESSPSRRLSSSLLPAQPQTEQVHPQPTTPPNEPMSDHSSNSSRSGDGREVVPLQTSHNHHVGNDRKRRRVASPHPPSPASNSSSIQEEEAGGALQNRHCCQGSPAAPSSSSPSQSQLPHRTTPTKTTLGRRATSPILECSSHSRRLLRILTTHRTLQMLQKHAHHIRPFGLLMFLSYMTEQLHQEDMITWLRHGTSPNGRSLLENGETTTTGETPPTPPMQPNAQYPSPSSQRRSSVELSSNITSSSASSNSTDSINSNQFVRICDFLYPLQRTHFLDYSASPLECTPYDPIRDFPPVATMKFFADKAAVLSIAAKVSPLGSASSDAPKPPNQDNLDPSLSISFLPSSHNQNRRHAIWCPWLTQGDACRCGDCKPINCGVIINEQFQKLFGWSQLEVRSMFMTEGFKSFFRFVRLELWAANLDAHLRDILTGEGESHGMIEIITKSGHTVRCIHHCRGSRDTGLGVAGMWQSFQPLPANYDSFMGSDESTNSPMEEMNQHPTKRSS